MNLPKIEDFQIDTEQGWNGAFLICPMTECPSRWIVAPASIGEAQDAAEEHIRAEHLPKLADGWRYCPTCHNAIYGRAVRCLECAE